MPFGQDLLTRIVNVHFLPVDQQGLVAEYRFTAYPTIGAPTAHALGSGDAFPGVNMGASGSGFTVLTPGLVCYGKPKNGAACFMASPNHDIKMSGQQSASIVRGVPAAFHIEWMPAPIGGNLVALTFAGEAFHAVFLDDWGNGGVRIETSFDGETWQAGSILAPLYGGAVAFNGNSYVSVGFAPVDTPDDEPDYNVSSVPNLAWGIANVPPSWSPPGNVTGVNGNPASHTGAGIVSLNLARTVAGGGGVFVAATYDKITEVITLPAGDKQARVLLDTAAAANSTTGSSWTNVTLPGVVKGYLNVSNDGDSGGGSYSTATVFVRTSDGSKGYFLVGAFSVEYDRDGTFTNYSTVCKSGDGHSWSETRRTTDGVFLTLSAIARDLSKTRIELI
jgi:hypothetical protein